MQPQATLKPKGTVTVMIWSASSPGIGTPRLVESVTTKLLGWLVLLWCGSEEKRQTWPWPPKVDCIISWGGGNGTESLWDKRSAFVPSLMISSMRFSSWARAWVLGVVGDDWSTEVVTCLKRLLEAVSWNMWNIWKPWQWPKSLPCHQSTKGCSKLLFQDISSYFYPLVALKTGMGGSHLKTATATGPQEATAVLLPNLCNVSTLHFAMLQFIGDLLCQPLIATAARTHHVLIGVNLGGGPQGTRAQKLPVNTIDTSWNHWCRKFRKRRQPPSSCPSLKFHQSTRSSVRLFVVRSSWWRPCFPKSWWTNGSQSVHRSRVRWYCHRWPWHPWTRCKWGTPGLGLGPISWGKYTARL